MALASVEINEILKLRVLIARAAQSDSLRWWDDNALTGEGLTLAGRLFRQKPESACVRLAMRSARARHRAAMPSGRDIVHLFDFGDVAELHIESALDSVDASLPGPIKSMDDLTAALSERGIASNSSRAPHGRPAWEMSASDSVSTLALARLLASGYVAGEAGRPVFPFVRLGSSRAA